MIEFLETVSQIGSAIANSHSDYFIHVRRLVIAGVISIIIGALTYLLLPPFFNLSKKLIFGILKPLVLFVFSLVIAYTLFRAMTNNASFMDPESPHLQIDVKGILLCSACQFIPLRSPPATMPLLEKCLVECPYHYPPSVLLRQIANIPDNMMPHTLKSDHNSYKKTIFVGDNTEDVDDYGLVAYPLADEDEDDDEYEDSMVTGRETYSQWQKQRQLQQRRRIGR